MTARSPPPPRPAPRATRADGDATRRQILEVAGRLYAEKGFARTTTKEICAAAGTNIAAVNYHFGGKDGLYETVLVEAHRQIVGLDELATIARAPLEAREKIRAVIRTVGAAAAKREAPWGMRVVVRELLAPTAHADTLIRRAIVPEAQIVRAMVAELLGLRPGDPGVDRGLAFVMMPAIALAIVPKQVLAQVVPSFTADPDALVDDLARYVLAGLEALRGAHPARGRPAAPRRPRNPTRG